MSESNIKAENPNEQKLLREKTSNKETLPRIPTEPTRGQFAGPRAVSIQNKQRGVQTSCLRVLPVLGHGKLFISPAPFGSLDSSNRITENLGWEGQKGHCIQLSISLPGKTETGRDWLSREPQGDGVIKSSKITEEIAGTEVESMLKEIWISQAADLRNLTNMWASGENAAPSSMTGHRCQGSALQQTW